MTTPPPCDEPSICTDKNYMDCVNDGAGMYHCENCSAGYMYSEEGDECLSECIIFYFLRKNAKISKEAVALTSRYLKHR